MAASKNDIEPFKHSLELEEDIPLHKKGWIIQKIGWTIFYILLILTALGLFGTGVLSHRTTAHNGDSVEYERFLRFEAEAEMTFRIANGSPEVRMVVPERYLEYIHIKAVNPVPDRTEIADNNMVYIFPTQNRATIHVTIMPKKWGKVDATIALNNIPFNLSHLIYP